MTYVLILASVVLAAIAQITLKQGMLQVTNHGNHPLDFGVPVTTVRRILTNLTVWGGLLIFVASAAVWIVVLSKLSLSFAYPFVSLTYVIILLWDAFGRHETIANLRWAGVAFIVAGIILVSRSAGPA